MQHKGTVNLVSKDIILRRFKIEDAEEMFSRWANDKEVTRYLNWEPHGQIEVTKEIISMWLSEYNSDNFYHWAIVFDNILIGSIGLLNPGDDKQEAEAGYCIAKSHWGKGIMAKCLKMVLDYAFNEVGFKKITAKHNVKNPNSGKVMVKCGMTFIETKLAPLTLDPNQIALCDCYEIAKYPPLMLKKGGGTHYFFIQK